MSARVDLLRELVASDPEDGLARYMLGEELLAAGDARGAAEHLEAAVRLTPTHTASWRELGKACEAADNRDRAIEAYQQGLLVSQDTGDLQTGKEIRVFLERLKRRNAEKEDG